MFNKNMNKVKGFLEAIRDVLVTIKSDISDIKVQYECLKDRISCVDKGVNDWLAAENKMLLELLCSKYSTGTIILYNEESPRTILVVENGKKVDLDGKNELSFYWARGEFPHLTIEN